MQFDGSPLDIATVVIALLAILIRPARNLLRGLPAQVSYRDAVVDFLNGTAIVPFLLLVGSVFSKQILEEALKTNKLALAYGGVIGLLFIVRELLKPNTPD